MSTGAHFSDQQPATPPPAAGDAGSDFLSGLLDAPTDAQGAQRVGEGGMKLEALAEGGGFAINEAGFQRYMAACDLFLQGYKEQKRKVDLLAIRPEMGSSDYAKKVATFNVDVATTGGDSLLPNLELMADGIQKAREALEIARKNYRETEDAHNQTFAKLHKSE